MEKRCLPSVWSICSAHLLKGRRLFVYISLLLCVRPCRRRPSDEANALFLLWKTEKAEGCRNRRVCMQFLITMTTMSKVWWRQPKLGPSLGSGTDVDVSHSSDTKQVQSHLCTRWGVGRQLLLSWRPLAVWGWRTTAFLLLIYCHQGDHCACFFLSWLISLFAGLQNTWLDRFPENLVGPNKLNGQCIYLHEQPVAMSRCNGRFCSTL